MLSCHQQKCYIFVNFDEYNLFDIVLLLFMFLILNLDFNHFFVILHIFFGKYTLTFLSAPIYFFNQIKEHSLKQHMCKSKIGKITYSKSQSRTMYDYSKNKPHCILNRHLVLTHKYCHGDPCLHFSTITWLAI